MDLLIASLGKAFARFRRARDCFPLITAKADTGWEVRFRDRSSGAWSTGVGAELPLTRGANSRFRDQALGRRPTDMDRKQNSN